MQLRAAAALTATFAHFFVDLNVLVEFPPSAVRQSTETKEDFRVSSFAISPKKRGSVTVAGFSRQAALSLRRETRESVKASLVATSPLATRFGSL